MRIGLHFPVASGEVDAIDELISAVRHAADAGMSTIWFRQLSSADALTEIAVAGRHVPRIELGTAVVPTYPRHPLMLASQALTVQAACNNRLTLGIGVSHKRLMERAFGYSFERPARHMREYLSALLPLLRGEKVRFEGETLTAKPFQPPVVAGATPPSVLVAAFLPAMLRLTGELADGTVTNMVGPRTLGSHITPTITRAAHSAGRGAPRIVVGLPVLVTGDPDAGRRCADETFGVYGTLPSYQEMLEREQVSGPGGIAVVGDEEAVAEQLNRFEDAGATDVAGLLFGDPEEQVRTVRLLSALARESKSGDALNRVTNP